MAQKRRKTNQQRRRPGAAVARKPGRSLADAGLILAQQALSARNWQLAREYADAALESDRQAAEDIIAQALFREARELAFDGDFQRAVRAAERAQALRPHDLRYQTSRRLLAEAMRSVAQSADEPLFRDTMGPSLANWWDLELLRRVRGSDDDGAGTVERPLILKETARGAVAGVYAVGPYQPWHVAGPDPPFSRYVKALKPSGTTIPYASMLLRQGLICETKWIGDIDAIVPMATSLRSYENRDFELTEELAEDLAARLCVSYVDVFERDPASTATHMLAGYDARAQALSAALRVKVNSSAILSRAEAILVIDDVVTTGATFEACARRLREAFGARRIYGAALAYTETEHRRARAQAEQAAANH